MKALCRDNVSCDMFYRQALRDVPAQLLGAVTWPSEPS